METQNLGLKLELKVLWVEVVDADVTIFATAAVALAIRMEGNAVDRSKVALDSSKLFLKSQMEEPGLKLANPGGGCGHIHGFLTSSQHHMVIVGRESSRVDRTLCSESLLMFKSRGVEELSCVVLRCSDKHGHVSRQLDVIDLPRVFLYVHQHLSRLGAILVELSALVACDDALPEGAPDGTGDLGIITGDLHVGLVAVDLAWIPQIKEAHEALIPHLLVCGEHDDVAPKVKAAGPDS